MATETQKPSAAQEDMPTHPEEMKSVFDLRIGKSISLQGSARMTPAGVVTVGLMAALVAVAFGYAASATRRRY